MAQAVWYSISHFSSVGMNPINAVNSCLRLALWTSRHTHSLLMKKCFPSQTENDTRTQLEPHETFPADLLHIPSWVITLSVLKTELKPHLCVLRELRKHFQVFICLWKLKDQLVPFETLDGSDRRFVELNSSSRFSERVHPFPNVFYGLFPRWICEINPVGTRNVLSGPSG